MTDLVPEGSEVLWTACPPWDFEAPPADAETVAQQMHMVMHTEDGVGLSANQIGLLYRVFVMYDPETRQSFTCFNPEVTLVSQDVTMMEEGCLSFPGLRLKIKRPAEVHVRYQNISGDWVEEHLTGLMARCYQHELDHLNGICFVAQVGGLTLKMAERRRTKALKGK